MKKQYIAPASNIVMFEANEHLLSLSLQSGKTINSTNSAEYDQLSQKKNNPIWGESAGSKGIWED